jgi:hypothetical protein
MECFFMRLMASATVASFLVVTNFFAILFLTFISLLLARTLVCVRFFIITCRMKKQVKPLISRRSFPLAESAQSEYT